jgi:hypothetical protein
LISDANAEGSRLAFELASHLIADCVMLLAAMMGGNDLFDELQPDNEQRAALVATHKEKRMPCT